MALIQITPYRQWLNEYLTELGIVRKQSKKKLKSRLSSVEEKKYVPCTIIEDLEYLTALDPKEWKEQDHYAGKHI